MKRRFPKLLLLVMAIGVLLLPRTALAASSFGGFSDVNAGTPHVADVLWLKSVKISEGWEENGSRVFRGMSEIVRQDMAAFLYRLAGSPNYEPAEADMEYFSDVDEDTPHYKEILWLASTKISEGWLQDDGSRVFRGMDTVKRQDMAAFLHRLAEYMYVSIEGSSSLTFSDVTEKTAHYEDILWLASTGVSEGWPMNDGTREYRGMNSVVRQDMAAFLHRLYYILYPDRVGEDSVYVALPQLTLHTKPETTLNPSYVPYMTELTYICDVSTSARGSWSLVEYDGDAYYFWTKAGDESPVTAAKSSRQYATNTDIQARIVESALDILDNWKTEYVSGAEGEVQPSGAHGFDCSGFASYVLNGAVQQDVPVFELSANLQTLRTETVIYNKGIDGEFAVQDIWSNNDASAFSESKLQAGDLLFFNLAEEGTNYTIAPQYLANGCKLYGDSGEDLEGTTFNNEQGVNVTKWIASLKDNPNVVACNSESVSLLKEGKIAAMVTGPWGKNDIMDALGDDLGVAVYPTCDFGDGPVQMRAFQGVKLLAVNAATEYPLDAMELADYLSNAECQKMRFDAVGAIPCNKELRDTDEVKNDPITNVVSQMTEDEYTVLMPKLPELRSFWDLLDPIIIDAYGGNLTEADMQTKLDDLVADSAATAE